MSSRFLSVAQYAKACNVSHTTVQNRIAAKLILAETKRTDTGRPYITINVEEFPPVGPRRPGRPRTATPKPKATRGPGRPRLER